MKFFLLANLGVKDYQCVLIDFHFTSYICSSECQNGDYLNGIKSLCVKFAAAVELMMGKKDNVAPQ